MRVLTITNLYPPHALGGYEWSCHDVMRRFSERGDQVTVLTTTTRLPPDGGDEAEVADDVRRELEWYWDDHRLRSPPMAERARIERRNQRRLARILDEVRPEVVSVWNIGAMSLGLLRTVAERGIPLVYAVCDEWPIHAPAMDAWGRLFARRRVAGRVIETVLRVPSRPIDLGPTGAFCFVSEHTRQACHRGSDFSFPRSGVVHSGIEADDFPPVHDEPVGWGGRLLYVGRLDVRKGVLTAVDALARLDGHHTLELVGRGDAHDQIVRRAEERGVAERVQISARPRSELAAVYRDADVLLFTSEWDEPFGLTPIEAMACATPVIGTGTGGSGTFLIDGRTCLRYPPGDAVALADRVRALAADPELRASLVAGGRVLAAELTTDRLADVFAEWHDAAVAGYRYGQPPDRPLVVPAA